MDEATAFFAALDARGPDDPTRCRGWRVRDLVTHLAAGAEEESDLIEAVLRGLPERPTRSFAEREEAYRDASYPALLDALVRHSGRLGAATRELVDTGGTVVFTGARLTGVQVGTHSRSELVLHRWDLVGDDDTGRELLARDDLTTHAVTVLAAMPELQESIALRGRRPDRFAFRLRAPGSSDVRVVLGRRPTLDRPAADGPEPVVETSAADRLLLLWGRTPSAPPELSGIPADRRDALRAAWAV